MQSLPPRGSRTTGVGGVGGVGGGKKKGYRGKKGDDGGTCEQWEHSSLPRLLSRVAFGTIKLAASEDPLGLLDAVWSMGCR